MASNCNYWFLCGVWIKVFLAAVVLRSSYISNMIEARGRMSAIESIRVVILIVDKFIYDTERSQKNFSNSLFNGSPCETVQRKFFTVGVQYIFVVDSNPGCFFSAAAVNKKVKQLQWPLLIMHCACGGCGQKSVRLTATTCCTAGDCCDCCRIVWSVWLVHESIAYSHLLPRQPSQDVLQLSQIL